MSDRDRARRSFRNSLLRFLLMVAILLTAFIVFRQTELADRLTVERLTAGIETIRGWWWAPLALIGLWTVISPLALPGTPVLLAGGVVFGPWWGSLYNLIGATLGALTTYFFARFLGHDLVAHVLGERRLDAIERRVVHYGFWSLASLRLIPVPWPVLNFGAALANVPFWLYASSTVVGLPPNIFVLTFFYATLGSVTTQHDRQTLIWMLVALALLMLLALARAMLRRRAFSSVGEDALPPTS